MTAHTDEAQGWMRFDVSLRRSSFFDFLLQPDRLVAVAVVRFKAGRATLVLRTLAYPLGGTDTGHGSVCAH